MHDSSIAKLPPTVYFSHTQRTLTIFDAYPKALFHFLILPRLSTTDNDVGQHDPNASSSASELTSLRTLLRRRTRAEETLRSLADEAARLREEIEREMRARYGFVWDLWIGFHAVPSMVHLHLHVISSDLTAPGLKTKRHYNSFSPCTSFFVPLSEVRAWFAAPQDEFVKIARLTPTEYEPRLKDALKCFRCGETLKNMPTLKNHLQEEFDVLRKQDVGKLKRKREAESASGSHAVPHRTEQAKKTARLSKSP
ncbi:HIT-like domain-containing protein [Multifurca ochricompacta]|uniref:HIT-like domain-containing protein n=1 Tax=Multifurca ochricompacta TaxID=376703 RepID=A0AAD4QRL3_9AGAM|nr:HIT-like domain-containing protein [Multifurca ochricompacta]